MDIHREADNILASLEMSPNQLRFEFHQNGCTVILCNSAGEHHYQMAPSQLMTIKQLFAYGGKNLHELMEAGTVAYFTEEPQP